MLRTETKIDRFLSERGVLFIETIVIKKYVMLLL